MILCCCSRRNFSAVMKGKQILTVNKLYNLVNQLLGKQNQVHHQGTFHDKDSKLYVMDPLFPVEEDIGLDFWQFGSESLPPASIYLPAYCRETKSYSPHRGVEKSSVCGGGCARECECESLDTINLAYIIITCLMKWILHMRVLHFTWKQLAAYE